MKAMVLNRIQMVSRESPPLILTEVPEPKPNEEEILIKVTACGVCHTELDEIEGRTSPPKLPIILGHQVVGKVVEVGSNVQDFSAGDRVGVAWVYSTCGECEFCRQGNENLCIHFKATGRDADGGYAEYMKVASKFSYPIPNIFTDYEAAPLLCAGAIGYRSLNLSGIKDGQNLGLMGFGASAHIVLKLAKYLFPNSKIFVFARSAGERSHALELGASWAEDIDTNPPAKLQSIIDTTPVWGPIKASLEKLRPGGRLVINAIRKEEIDKEQLLKLDYASTIWMEKEIKSVANVTRKDVKEFLEIAAKIPIKPDIEKFEMKDANEALLELKERRIRGAKVLTINENQN